MQDKEDTMRVTIHAAYLNKDASEISLATQLLNKVVRTIEQFESRGWQAEIVDQDDVAATITFRRIHQADAAESEIP